MPSQPSSSEPSSGKEVPLFIYNRNATRTEIGTAVVTGDRDNWHAEAKITSEEAATVLGSENGTLTLNGPFSIGVYFPKKEPAESLLVLIPPKKA